MPSLKALREKKGLTQSELGEKTTTELGRRVTRHSAGVIISAIERGRYRPGPKFIYALCKVLKVSAQELTFAPAPTLFEDLTSSLEGYGVAEEDILLVLQNEIAHEHLANFIKQLCNKLRSALSNGVPT